MEFKTWAIIGGGNGGQTMAAHLSLLGQKVRLYDVSQDTVDAINAKGGIKLTHALTGFGKLEFASTDIARVMEGADNIIVVLPSIYHDSIAKKMIPYLQDGQVVMLHPEASCGAVAFRNNMKKMGSSADIILGAACTLLYSTRIVSPGEVYVYGVKNEVSISALPACDNAKLESAICNVKPWFHIVDSVVVTSLMNTNAMMHPAPMLLNTSRIEAEPPQDFQYYLEGITPSIGRFIETMDKERIAIAKEFGYKLRTIKEDYLSMYSCGDIDMPLYQIVRNNPGYVGMKCAKTLRTRYVLEDIPYSLVPIQALGRIAGIKTPCIDSIIAIGEAMLAGELDKGRTSEVLGIADMSKEDLTRFIMLKK